MMINEERIINNNNNNNNFFIILFVVVEEENNNNNNNQHRNDYRGFHSNIYYKFKNYELMIANASKRSYWQF